MFCNELSQHHLFVTEKKQLFTEQTIPMASQNYSALVFKWGEKSAHRTHFTRILPGRHTLTAAVTVTMASLYTRS